MVSAQRRGATEARITRSVAGCNRASREPTRIEMPLPKEVHEIRWQRRRGIGHGASPGTARGTSPRTPERFRWFCALSGAKLEEHREEIRTGHGLDGTTHAWEASCGSSRVC